MILLLVLLLSQYPEDIRSYIEKADIQAVCEADQSSVKSVMIYRNSREKWLIRVFIKNGEAREIWLNQHVLFKIFIHIVDKVYYRTEGGRWIDKDTLTKQEADALDAQIKFNKKEIATLEKCFEKKLK